jgi:acyl-CoA thioesterase-2
MPEIPAPEDCPSWEEMIALRARREGGHVPPWARRRPVEMRPAIERGKLTPGERDDHGSDLVQRFWIKADTMPDDPLMHLCVAAHTSDHSLLGAMRRPHGGAPSWNQAVMSASLDHALYFHKAFRMDQWLLYDQESPVTAHARGLAHGRFFTQAGELVASVTQEGLICTLDPQRSGD